MIAAFQTHVVLALFIVSIVALFNADTRRIGLIMVMAWASQEVIARVSLGGPLMPLGGSFTAAPWATLEDYAPWRWFLVVNITATFLILLPYGSKLFPKTLPKPSRINAVIGSFFAFQIILDMSFGLSGNLSMTRSYLVLQTNILWAEIIILGLYSAGHYSGRLRRFGSSFTHKLGKRSVGG